MLDIKDLERRWLKYKIKSYAPYTLGTALFTAIFIASVSWFLSSPDPLKSSDAPEPAAEQHTVPAITQDNRSIPVENTTLLEPSMEFVQTFQDASPDDEIPPAALPKTTRSVSYSSLPVPPPKVLAMPEAVPAEPSAQPAQTFSRGTDRSLTINRNESKLDIEELKQRFKETSNSNLGLFIARYYYDQGNYAEAYNYALKTNAVNTKIDESWIIFSKSLVKLGKMEQAKKTLQLYIQQSNSENAKGLLESIEKGTFK